MSIMDRNNDNMMDQAQHIRELFTYALSLYKIYIVPKTFDLKIQVSC